MKISARVLFLIGALALFASFGSAQAKAKAKVKPTPKAVKAGVETISRSGSFEGDIYTNTVLGVTISIPRGWTLIHDDANAKGLKASKDRITENRSESFKDQMEESVSNTRILFQALHNDPADYRSAGAFAGGIEDNAAGQTLSYYTKFNRDLVISSNPGSKLTRDIYQTILDGTPFQSFEVEIPSGEQTQKQTFLVTTRRGVLFFFVLTYLDDAGKRAMERSLKEMKFAK